MLVIKMRVIKCCKGSLFVYVFKKYRFLLKNTGLWASKYRFVFPEVGMSGYDTLSNECCHYNETILAFFLWGSS